jgi:hypothetical protein
VQQCAAVRAAVCGSSTVAQRAAVRLVVYGSTRGSVWLSGSAVVCVAVCSSARGGVR